MNTRSKNKIEVGIQCDVDRSESLIVMEEGTFFSLLSSLNEEGIDKLNGFFVEGLIEVRGELHEALEKIDELERIQVL